MHKESIAWLSRALCKRQSENGVGDQSEQTSKLLRARSKGGRCRCKWPRKCIPSSGLCPHRTTAPLFISRTIVPSTIAYMGRGAHCRTRCEFCHAAGQIQDTVKGMLIMIPSPRSWVVPCVAETLNQSLFLIGRVIKHQ
jgi:hypothetical protein